MKTIRQIAKATAVLAGFAAATMMPAAAKWPMDKPMTIVVNWTPGSGIDVLSRILADGLMKKWGNKIIVENRAGASGNIGQAYVAKAEPDGYTWLHTTPGPAANNMVSFRQLPYNPLTDFTPITMTHQSDMILVTRNSLAKDFNEFLGKAKASPGTIQFAHPGIGTYGHLLGLKIEEVAGIKLNTVPYKGGPQMLPDLMQDRIDIVVDQIPSWIEHVKSKKVTALATFGERRSPILPDVPTMKELGFNILAAPWYGIEGPKGVPSEIAEEMAKAVAEVLKDPANAEKIKAANFQPTLSTPAEFKKTIEDEVASWGPVIRKYNLYVD